MTTTQWIAVLIVVALLASIATYFAVPPRVVEKVVEKPVEVEVLPKLKAGFIYVGPIGDIGWTFAHDQGRLYCENTFPFLETVYREAVPEPECARVIEELIAEGCKVIFTTSFGFMDPTLEAAKKHPDVFFFHCSGYKRHKNMGTYFAEFYQLYYLNGLMAGALTKTNKVGYVAAFLIPELVRHINAFAIGVHEVNPDAKVYVIEMGTAWYDPPKARECAETLIAKGCDVIAFTEDSPTVVQVCEEHTLKGERVLSFAHYSPMLKFGPNSCVSGQLVHWEVIYADILAKIYTGVYTTENLENVDYWWMLKEEAVELGADFGVPINEKFLDELKAVKVKERITGREISVYELIFLRLKQMSEESPTFDPFTGPLYGWTSSPEELVQVAAPGERLGHDELWMMQYWIVPVYEAPPLPGPIPAVPKG